MGEFKTSSHLTAGFVGGLASAVLLQPLDLLKTRLQQSPGSKLMDTVRGLKSPLELWRGTLPSALRTSLGASMYLTCLGRMRASLANYSQPDRGYSSELPKLSSQANLATGAVARGLVGFITMPITVVKVRFESSLYHYKSLAEVVKALYVEKGTRGFFYGYGVTLTRDAPYAGLYVLFYEQCKDLLNGLFPAGDSQRTITTSAALNSMSAVSAAIAATTVTSPFDTVKTRVQLNPEKYKSFLTAIRLIMKEESFMSLFSGLSLRLTRKALSSGVSWCIYEELVRLNAFKAKPSL